MEGVDGWAPTSVQYAYRAACVAEIWDALNAVWMEKMLSFLQGQSLRLASGLQQRMEIIFQHVSTLSPLEMGQHFISTK